MPRALILVLLALAVLAVAGVGVALEVAPLALLALPLLFGHYPGERVIERLARYVGASRIPGSFSIPRVPRSVGARIAALATPGSGRAPPTAAVI